VDDIPLELLKSSFPICEDPLTINPPKIGVGADTSVSVNKMNNRKDMRYNKKQTENSLVAVQLSLNEGLTAIKIRCQSQ